MYFFNVIQNTFILIYKHIVIQFKWRNDIDLQEKLYHFLFSFYSSYDYNKILTKENWEYIYNFKFWWFIRKKSSFYI